MNGMDLRLAEATAERDVGVGVRRLAGEEQHEVLEAGAEIASTAGVVEGGEVDAAHLGAAARR